MNETIERLLCHRSIRKYKPAPVEPDKVEAIIHCAQMASTSSSVQAYSVIGVTDAESKKQLAEWSTHTHVATCPLLLVWCADLRRLNDACEMHGGKVVNETTESFLIATVDAALAAQNAAVAAESLGLGICYIGGLRNRIAEVTELLDIPKLVYPVFGMCVGYPDQEPVIRPRLPIGAVYHKERYDGEAAKTYLPGYDETYSAYMKERSGGKSTVGWTSQMAVRMGQPDRVHMRDYLIGQGFELK